MPASTGPALPLSLFPATNWWALALQTEEPGLFTDAVTGGAHLYNRYNIATANGVQQLSVPVKGGRKQLRPLGDMFIDYMHDWQRQHWGALYSAYGRAPYYEHYAPALKAIIYRGYERLEDLNMDAVNWLTREMQLAISFNDKPAEGLKLPQAAAPAYHQVFEERWGFLPGLSAIDLLMNEGPYSSRFLTV